MHTTARRLFHECERRFYVESLESLEDRVALDGPAWPRFSHMGQPGPGSRLVRPGLSSDPLPIGTWNINANSFRGSLVITSVGTNGRFTGTVFGNRIDGFWDEGAQKVIFIRVPGRGQ